MRRFIGVRVGLVLLAGVWIAVGGGFDADLWGDPPVSQIKDAEGDLMKAKLSSSQNVLEGLCRNDFDLIGRGAREMKRISHAAEWPRHRDPVYEHFSTEFRRQCNLLEDFAQRRNREAVSFTYLHTTTICISCHDYVRDSRRVADMKPRGDVQLIPSEWPEPNQAEVKPSDARKTVPGSPSGR
ncbi:hypothetical protein Poly51_52650 [Rubripirellula tenax]|uniref:Cytochrome C n=1 Tax=Rubripirellula tenax TaxID=2528015 RepID=A0A5C6EG22_9BACT|nr:hypothetical protein [Rubripirellula tenax]TWU47465.1 hypothetical protein Poly51_52650 [Rubripirellula tenax]